MTAPTATAAPSPNIKTTAERIQTGRPDGAEMPGTAPRQAADMATETSDPMPWTEIRRTVAAARFRALSTVDADGAPRVTPIGSVVLTGEGRGFYFEDDTAVMPGGLERAAEVAILAVGGAGSWWRRLLRGALPPGPALRLKVRAGRRRAATAAERALRLAGAGLLGRSVGFVREFTVQGVAPVHLGALLK